MSSVLVPRAGRHDWGLVIIGAITLFTGTVAALGCVSGQAGRWRGSGMAVGRVSAAGISVGFLSIGTLFISDAFGIERPSGLFVGLVMLGWIVAVIGYALDRAATRHVPRPAVAPIRARLTRVNIRDLPVSVWALLLLMVLMLLRGITGT